MGETLVATPHIRSTVARVLFHLILTAGLMVSLCPPAQADQKQEVGIHRTSTSEARARRAKRLAHERSSAKSRSRPTTVDVPGGSKVVPMSREGNSLFIDVKLNSKARGRFLLDTGCSETQISSRLARRLGIRRGQGQKVMCRIAGGRVIEGRIVNLSELKVGRVTARNVPVVVLRQDKGGYDGLLGMSFLNHFIFQVDPKRAELTLKRR